MLQRTSTAHAPWTVVEATQGRFARVKVFETIVQARRARSRAAGDDAEAVARSRCPSRPDSPTRQQTILDRVDLSLSLERREVREAAGQAPEAALPAGARAVRRPDPGGRSSTKAGTPAARGATSSGSPGASTRAATRWFPSAAPTAEEKAHHYLWRFWRDVPKAGHITIFDRSWYGRVLVERVEGFCTEDEWKRAYREINEFERQLADFGTVIVKFWLHIDREEQLRRFEAREETPHKQWKITDEDWRNREKWEQYEVGRRRHAPADQHDLRPLDDPRGQLQALRPHQGPPHRRRSVPKRPQQRMTARSCLRTRSSGGMASLASPWISPNMPTLREGMPPRKSP